MVQHYLRNGAEEKAAHQDNYKEPLVDSQY